LKRRATEREGGTEREREREREREKYYTSKKSDQATNQDTGSRRQEAREPNLPTMSNLSFRGGRREVAMYLWRCGLTKSKSSLAL